MPVARTRFDLVQGIRVVWLLALSLTCGLVYSQTRHLSVNTHAASSPSPAQASPAVPATLQGSCASLTRFHYPNTRIDSAQSATPASLKVAGQHLPPHCVVRGSMYSRISPVDGQHYEIGFELRLPIDWNGRFFYQNPVGTMGLIEPAIGLLSEGGTLHPALQQGFAVLSSDGGHNRQQNPSFGLDPQARSDYGYASVLKLTPMAKTLIQQAYGKRPDRSYAGGSSNGGRLALVAGARMPDEYDGILANSPGLYLPMAALAQLHTAQQLRRIATDPKKLSSAFTTNERQVLAHAILARCDQLDGLDDLMVQDVEGCRKAFKIERDVPRCPGGRDGSCLSNAQIDVISRLYQGPINSRGQVLYASQPYDPGMLGDDWAQWKFSASIGNTSESSVRELPVNERDPIAVALIFQVPPQADVTQSPQTFAFNYDFDLDPAKLSATNSIYQESALDFMLTPSAQQMQTLQQRGGKVLLVHGTADAVFSVDATTAWYRQLLAQYKDKTANFARFFRVPGMNHSDGGLATDQFDALSALVRWVEYGETPNRIVAHVRGYGNSARVNDELPMDWSPDRSRPLCPYPQIARYNGHGDSERAESFSCRP